MNAVFQNEMKHAHFIILFPFICIGKLSGFPITIIWQLGWLSMQAHDINILHKSFDSTHLIRRVFLHLRVDNVSACNRR